MKGLFVVKENRPHNGVMPVTKFTVEAIPCFDDTVLELYKELCHELGFSWDEFETRDTYQTETEGFFESWSERCNDTVYSQDHFEDAMHKKGISIDWVF